MCTCRRPNYTGSAGLISSFPGAQVAQASKQQLCLQSQAKVISGDGQSGDTSGGDRDLLPTTVSLCRVEGCETEGTGKGRRRRREPKKCAWVGKSALTAGQRHAEAPSSSSSYDVRTLFPFGLSEGVLPKY